MNILKAIVFNLEKPAVLSVRKTDTINLFAVGLLKNQLLKKHKASIPSLLTVLTGSFEFRIDNKNIRLAQFDTLQIPVNEEHEVEGLDERNVFTILQEKRG
ncbi:MAG: hypothetical protein DRI69_05545 [Bacteroidetes bacterium]|nr:MAG: hypothetical protein DRI69_05545 [Bacteroidota bacterium]